MDIFRQPSYMFFDADDYSQLQELRLILKQYKPINVKYRMVLIITYIQFDIIKEGKVVPCKMSLMFIPNARKALKMLGVF